MITHEKLENLGSQGAGSSIPMVNAVSADLVSPDKRHRNATTIDILSDNILLEMFDHCRKRDDQYYRFPYCVWEWHLLVHVCRRWQQIIFASPRRLDLQLLCTYATPIRKIMGIWPTIPIILIYWSHIEPSDGDNVTAALKHPNRVSRINLVLDESQLTKIAVLMQRPFPVLTHLSISSHFGKGSALPNGFLGGSAPSLQQIDLHDILYPALPRLLFSASNLVDLRLRNIPPTGYISPEAMVSHVATSPKLETLYIEFSTLSSFPDIFTSLPITRTVLPALHNFSFSGACKYWGDFVSRIDTPQLISISVYYLDGGDVDINFDVLHLPKFVDRSESLKRSLSRHCKIMVDQDEDVVTFCVGRTTSERWDPKPGISVCLAIGAEEEITHLTKILGFVSPILSDIVHCTIDSVLPVVMYAPEFGFEEQEDRDLFDWPQLLRQLLSLQTLFVAYNSTDLISRAPVYLNEEMITEVLPALKLLCLEEEIPTPSVHKFLAVRRDSGHPVTFVKTKGEFEEKLKSYQ